MYGIGSVQSINGEDYMVCGVRENVRRLIKLGQECDIIELRDDQEGVIQLLYEEHVSMFKRRFTQNELWLLRECCKENMPSVGLEYVVDDAIWFDGVDTKWNVNSYELFVKISKLKESEKKSLWIWLNISSEMQHFH